MYVQRTFEYSSIPRLDGQRSNIGDDLGTCLENYQQDSNRTRNPFQFQPVVQSCPQNDLIDCLVQILQNVCIAESEKHPHRRL